MGRRPSKSQRGFRSKTPEVYGGAESPRRGDALELRGSMATASNLGGERQQTEARSVEDVLRKYKPEGVDEREVLRVAGILEENGVSLAWHFRHITPQIVNNVCVDPLTRDLDHRAFLLTSSVVSSVQKDSMPQLPSEGDRPSTEFAMASVSAMKPIAHMARSGADRKRDGWSASSSDSEDKNTNAVDVYGGLKRYGLEDIPMDNLPKSSALQPLLRKARRKANHGRWPWVPGDLTKDFEPLKRTTDSTLKPVQKGQTFYSFAHFSSCWWSRALCQLALQAEVGAEAVTFERLLRRFLDLCHLAQAKGVNVAYEYDAQEWAAVATEVENKVKTVDPAKAFARINTDTRRDVQDQLEKARQMDKGAQGRLVHGSAPVSQAASSKVRQLPAPPWTAAHKQYVPQRQLPSSQAHGRKRGREW